MGIGVWLSWVKENSLDVSNYPGVENSEDFEDAEDDLGLEETPTMTPTMTLESGKINEGFPGDTLIVFDWDDTLLCSSAINMHSWTHEQLDVLSRTVETTLRAAMELGEVMIVTNGVDWWVKDSCRRFLPGLLPLLGELTVKSARAVYERVYPGDPFAWKREAFKDILAPRRRATNLVVLGDSLSEIQAARGARKVLAEKSLVKTVKFKEAPSANDLVGQLRRVAQELDSIVQRDGHSSHDLERRALPANSGHTSGRASGWRISNGKDDGEFGCFSDPLNLNAILGNAGTDFSKSWASSPMVAA